MSSETYPRWEQVQRGQRWLYLLGPAHPGGFVEEFVRGGELCWVAALINAGPLDRTFGCLEMARSAVEANCLHMRQAVLGS